MGLLCQVVFFYLSAVSYILVPVFLGFILLVWLLLLFLPSFDPLCHPGYLGFLHIWCYFSTLSPNSFVFNSRADYMLLCALKLLLTFWRRLWIFLYFLCICCHVFILPGEAVPYTSDGLRGIEARVKLWFT